MLINCKSGSQYQAQGRTWLRSEQPWSRSGSWEERPPPGEGAAANPHLGRCEDEDGWKGRKHAAEHRGSCSDSVAFHSGLCISLLLNLQQNSLKCFHCKSHNGRDKSLRLSPLVTGLTPITFVEDVSYWIYLSGGQGDLLPGSRHKMLKNPGDPRQGEGRGGWHQTPELREFTCNSGEWESYPPVAVQLLLGKGAAGALHWKPCPRGADRLPKTACACSCPKPVVSERKATFACFTQGFGGLFPAPRTSGSSTLHLRPSKRNHEWHTKEKL